jgi:hypothetical protein
LHYSAAITYWQTHDNLALFLKICRFRHLLRHQGGVEFLVFHLYAQTSLCICYIDEKALLHSQILLFVGGWFRDLNACLMPACCCCCWFRDLLVLLNQSNQQLGIQQFSHSLEYPILVNLWCTFILLSY